MTYIVQKGDTLSEIAKDFDTTVEALVASNNIKDKNLIYPGQVLVIPTSDDSLYHTLNACLVAIEKLPEFKALEAMLDD